MSWAGKLLRVDLTAGTCKSEPLNMDWARQYLGQRGLATKYFVEEVDAGVDPLGADNKLIWATGPLTGTMASTGGREAKRTKKAGDDYGDDAGQTATQAKCNLSLSQINSVSGFNNPRHRRFCSKLFSIVPLCRGWIKRMSHPAVTWIRE